MPHSVDKVRLYTARDLLCDVMASHRSACASDCGEVGNLLGYLAHCLGATPRDREVFHERFDYYHKHCLGCPRCAGPEMVEAAEPPGVEIAQRVEIRINLPYGELDEKSRLRLDNVCRVLSRGPAFSDACHMADVLEVLSRLAEVVARVRDCQPKGGAF